MTSRPNSASHTAQAIFCLVLTVNLHIWPAGCGNALDLFSGGVLRVALTADHPIKTALKTTAFSAASTIEIDRQASSFRILYPDPSREVTGTFAIVEDAAVVSAIDFTFGPLSIRFSFDVAHRIVSMSTSTGQSWQPSESSTEDILGLGHSGVDAYIAANAELVDAARRSDPSPTGGGGGGVGGGSDGSGHVPGTGAKELLAGQDIFGGPLGILGTLVVVTGLSSLSVWPALYFVFQVVVAVNLTLAILNVGGGSVASAGNSATAITGSAILRVVDNLSGSVPIWFVVLIENKEQRLPGGNLLGNQAIPAGESRAFNVPPGTRDINIIVPHGPSCYMVYREKEVNLMAGKTLEIVIDDSRSGEILPPDCQDG